MSAESKAIGFERHAGPPLWVLAALYAVLFCAGLYPVTGFSGKGYWPPPSASPAAITSYFPSHSGEVLTCIFLQSGAFLCLGLFTANTVSRMYFLGVRSVGLWITLLGGFLTVFDGLAAGFIGWAMIQPVIVFHEQSVLELYYVAFGFGGPGFSIPMGLLMAGIAIPAAMRKLLPRWLIVIGLALAAVGELSWFYLIDPKLLPLIPLTRFPGFLWLIAAGFLLPGRRPALVHAAA